MGVAQLCEASEKGNVAAKKMLARNVLPWLTGGWRRCGRRALTAVLTDVALVGCTCLGVRSWYTPLTRATWRR